MCIDLFWNILLAMGAKFRQPVTMLAQCTSTLLPFKLDGAFYCVRGEPTFLLSYLFHHNHNTNSKASKNRCQHILSKMQKKITKVLQLIFISELREKRAAYLLQQRALEQLNTFVKVLAATPRDWPRARASDTPSMLTAIAKLLHIFAA